MRYAVVSDVHANLEALRAVLHDADTQADAVVCLGDIVGYGADPVACIGVLAERAEAIVAGNHEHGAVGLTPSRWFSRDARTAIEWTGTRLDRDHRAWLAARPLVHEIEDATLVHASPRQPDEWDYLIGAEEGWSVFGDFATRVCFVGHSHRPAVWSLGSSGPDYEAGPAEITLESGRRYIINVGSVGQPRDGDPRAAYAVWDPDARRVAVRRVAYDVATARRKIAEAGLPRFLAERLAVAE